MYFFLHSETAGIGLMSLLVFAESYFVLHCNGDAGHALQSRTLGLFVFDFRVPFSQRVSVLLTSIYEIQFIRRRG